jgi:putative ABC transport system permease protein
VLRLAWSNLSGRLARTLLTAAAVALSVSLVVSTTSGYRSGAVTVRSFVEQYLGNADFRVSSGVDAEGLPASLVAELERDPRVRDAFGRYETSLQMRDSEGNWTAGRMSVLGVDPSQDSYLERLPLSYGRLFTSRDAPEVVIDQGAARVLKVDLGDTIQLPGPGGATELTVVGVVHKPELVAALLQTIYVPLQTLQRAVSPQNPDRLTSVIGEYELDVDSAAFLDQWQARLTGEGKSWSITPVREQREALDDGLRGMNLLSLMGGMVSLLAATFIVFGTLSMGVAERQRTLAMLRAVGATRSQVATSVVLEGGLLAMLGVAIGIPLGLIFIWSLVLYFQTVFTAGLAVSWLGVSVATGGMAIAAVVASLLPAWQAGRTDPLEAMRPSAAPQQPGAPWGTFIVGVALVSLDSLLLWPEMGVTPLPEQLEKDVRFWVHFFIGLPCLMLGFFLVGPMAVWLIERLLAPLTSRIWRIEPALLRQQLSSGLWRAAGTAAALMVGLAVLIVMNTQGRSSIEGWELPDAFPDVFLYDFSGISQQDLEAISRSEPIRHLSDGTPDLTPIGYFHPQLGDSVFVVSGAAFQPDRTMFVAVDPRRIFDLMDLEFTEGTMPAARRMLIRGEQATLADGRRVHGSFEETPEGRRFVPLEAATGMPADHLPEEVIEHEPGRYLVISEEFRELRGSGVGDIFTLKKPGEGILGRLRGEPVDFTIVGVVRSPGIDVMVATFDMGRQFQAQSAASVFGTLEDARNIFNMTSVRLVAANLDVAIEKKELVAQLTEDLGRTGISVADVRQLKHEIQTGLRRLLLVASVVAWSAMAVASLGVVNTIMAGVRARRYQLGILRAVGLSQAELVRLVLAEALLLGLVAAVMGTAAGLLMTFNARQLQSWVIGYVPPLRIAWGVFGLGVAAVLIVSIAAALWPAISTARTAVLRLLQSGRAAT